MRAGLSFSRSPISLLLRQPLSIKKSYAGAIQELKPATAWGCPSSMKCQFKEMRSALTPSLPLLCACVYIKTGFGN
jgi:hypothetical protein